MKSLWKSLCIACALFGFVTIGIAAGCGPEKAFCPNGPSGTGVCPILGDDGGGIQQDSQTPTCDPGFKWGLEPDGVTFGCIPA
ncbi:MAG TPA: hypothetical protein VIK30_09795 [Polyangia bacterium]